MKHVVRIILTSVAFVVGAALSGMLAPFLHLPQMNVPANTTTEKMFVAFLASSPLLGIGMIFLARGLRGSWTQRLLALAALLYFTIGLNTAIEAKIFTSLVPGSAVLSSLQSLLPCLMAAAVLAGAGSPGDSVVCRLSPAAWAGRLLLAWMAFPVIYWTFGMAVAPFVIQQYTGGPLGLRIPPATTILLTQLLRSTLFLAASLPAVLLWRKSRTHFIVAMGLAHAFAVGIFQLAGASFMPVVLRVAHSIEITADSFAYAAVLGLLFIAKATDLPARTRVPNGAERVVA